MDADEMRAAGMELDARGRLCLFTDARRIRGAFALAS